MRYSVIWITKAEDDLAAVWLIADDAGAVTTSQVEIDRLLARNPIGNGQLLHEGLRKIVVRPLTAYYEVNGSRRIVEVQEIRYTP